MSLRACSAVRRRSSKSKQKNFNSFHSQVFTGLTVQPCFKANPEAAEDDLADTLVGQEASLGAQHQRPQHLYNLQQHNAIRVVVAADEASVRNCVSDILNDARFIWICWIWMCWQEKFFRINILNGETAALELTYESVRQKLVDSRQCYAGDGSSGLLGADRLQKRSQKNFGRKLLQVLDLQHRFLQLVEGLRQAVGVVILRTEPHSACFPRSISIFLLT